MQQVSVAVNNILHFFVDVRKAIIQDLTCPSRTYMWHINISYIGNIGNANRMHRY